MTNPLSTLQGGIFTVMMDDTLGVAVYSLGKNKFYTTINFYTDYLGSAAENDLIIVSAKVIRHGNTILNVGITVENQDKKLLAKGNSNLVAKDIEGFVLPTFEGFQGNW
jgi:acyl-coenzyme A thioesterase PaaI-like protein